MDVSEALTDSAEEGAGFGGAPRSDRALVVFRKSHADAPWLPLDDNETVSVSPSRPAPLIRCGSNWWCDRSTATARQLSSSSGSAMKVRVGISHFAAGSLIPASRPCSRPGR